MNERTERPGRVAVEIASAPPPAALQAEWLELEASSEASFFLSWSWIGAWLRHLPAEVHPLLVRASLGGRVVGLALLCEGVRRRPGLPMGARALFLHSTGREELDELAIEYNGLLAERGREAEVLEAVLAAISARRRWEEMSLPGWYRTDLLPALRMPGALLLYERRRPCRFVDLRRLRESGRPYVETLPSGGARRALRHTRRDCEARGLAVAVARDAAEGAEYLRGLAQLHGATWRERGLPGCFVNPHFQRFHSAMVETGVPGGFVQLVRVSMGERAIGYLYGFVHRGRVYAYQTGFDYHAFDKTWSPGLLCHALAVELNRDLGHDIYDFMAGDVRYKRELATESSDMDWLVLQRPRLKFRVHEMVRRAVRRLRGTAS